MGIGINWDYLITLATTVLLVLVSTVLHELAHAACALALGDPTAKEAGRLTLNPLAHLHPVGSIVLPILMAVAGGPVFAFAKPVPYNPQRLRHPVRDEVLVAFAGPFCNLLQALVGCAVFRLTLSSITGGGADPSEVSYQVLTLSATYTYLNLMLMFFNLIPLPPLDGSAIISPLLTGRARTVYYEVQRYSLPILLIIMYLLPSVLHVDILGRYLDLTAGNLTDLFLGL